MILAAKKSAPVIFSSRRSFIGSYWYNDVLDNLETDRRLKQLDREDFFKYDRIQSSIGRFSRTPARVFVYENLIDARTFELS